jgi:hypothetical protein
MHAFLEGIVKYTVRYYFNGIGLTKASKIIDAAIDKTVQIVGIRHTSSVGPTPGVPFGAIASC